MNYQLKPYTRSRKACLPWLDTVPATWGVRRAKYLFSKIDVRSETGSEELLTVSSADGVRKRSEKAVTMFLASSYSGYKLCWPSDLVINSLWAWATGFGFSKHHGIISSAYGVYRLNRDLSEDFEFFHHLLRSRTYDWEFTVRSKGIWVSRLQLTDESFLDTPILLPPSEDRKAIVRFIRHLDQRVNRLIQAKRQLIALLNEQKQAILAAAFKSLHPTKAIKDMWQIGHLAKVGNGSTPSRGNPNYWSSKAEIGYPWLNSASVNQGTIRSSNQFVTDLALRECHLPKVPSGSVLMAITGQGKTRGTAAILDMEATINQHLAYITPRQDLISTDYLYLALTAAYRNLREVSEASGSTKGALTCWELKRFKVGVPHRDYQDRIVLQVRCETESVDRAMWKIQSEVDLISEYRTRLVADVVTGQLDVRHLNLPDVIDEPVSVIDEPGDLADMADDDMVEAAL